MRSEGVRLQKLTARLGTPFLFNGFYAQQGMRDLQTEGWATEVLSTQGGSSKGDVHITWGRVGCGWLNMQVPELHARLVKSESLRLVLGLTFESISLEDWMLWRWPVAVIFGLFSGVLNSNTEIQEALGCRGGSGSLDSRALFTHNLFRSWLLAMENQGEDTSKETKTVALCRGTERFENY